MLRERFPEALRTAMKGKDQRTVSTVRMVMAKLQERDIEARAKGNLQGIAEAEIQSLLQGMVKQRRESIELYEKGGRKELADQEREEIGVLERFLPQPMGEAEMEAAIRAVVAELGAAGPKDMGRVMTALRERHAGAMDFSKASPLARRLLG